MSEDREAFLDRWSRLKQEESKEEPAVPETKKGLAEPAAPLPAVEDLKPDSDYRPFMGAQVDPATRRSALKKLFTDAHYNIPDPFEAYSEDYTKSEPISEAMLKTLNQAQKLLFDDADTAQAPSSNTAQATVEKPEMPQPEGKDVAGKQDA